MQEQEKKPKVKHEMLIEALKENYDVMENGEVTEVGRLASCGNATLVLIHKQFVMIDLLNKRVAQLEATTKHLRGAENPVDPSAIG